MLISLFPGFRNRTLSSWAVLMMAKNGATIAAID